MISFRSLLFRLLFLLSIIFIVRESWTPRYETPGGGGNEGGIKKDPHEAFLEYLTKIYVSLDESPGQSQAEPDGSRETLFSPARTAVSSSIHSALISQIESILAKYVSKSPPPSEQTKEPPQDIGNKIVVNKVVIDGKVTKEILAPNFKPRLFIKGCISACKLPEPEPCKTCLERLQELKDIEDDDYRLMAIVSSIYLGRLEKSKQDKLIITDKDSAFITNKLGWFGELAIGDYRFPKKSHLALKESALNQAKQASIGALVLSLGGLLVFICSIICLPSISIAFMFRFTRLHFRLAKQNKELLFECFALYLAGMFLGGKCLAFVLSDFPLSTKLLANLALISSLGCLCFWPLLYDKEPDHLEMALGLRSAGFLKNVGDFFLALLSYLSFWPFLLCAMFLTYQISNFLGWDIDKAAHPIIPLVGKLESTSDLFIMYVLAVLVAPIVEELMFRGAFYHYLRSNYSAFTAMFVSSFVFALIHPQGPLGILILTTVGLLLSFLREWRGSLLPCIFAHIFINFASLTLAVLLKPI